MKKSETKLSNTIKLNPKTDTAPHLIVNARAGTGKTTTLVEGLKIIKGIGTEFTPSSQQAKVWEAMELSKGKVNSICFVAFNKSIATELQNRVPEGCNAMTMHSMGLKAITKAFGRVNVEQFRVQDIISEIIGKDIRELRKYKYTVISATQKLVSLCKMNLTGLVHAASDLGQEIWTTPDCEELADLASHYDVDLNGDTNEVFELVPKVLERCKDVQRDGCIDYDDMIWIPVALGLPIFCYDLLLVDEAQDLNRCQQALAMKAGSRLILCGDPKQAIYGFAGADSESMPRMEQILSDTNRGCDTLPLTVTRRCGRAIVEEAKKIVPDFEAHESCGEGLIRTSEFEGDDCSTCNNTGLVNYPQGDTRPYESGKVCPDCRAKGYRKRVRTGDMILCRCNAPLISECFKFLKEGRKAVIQGRDIGKGLISTINKLIKQHFKIAGMDTSVPDLVGKLSDWVHKETAKENRKRNPNDSRLIALQDRYDCLCCFCEDQTTVEAVIKKIEAVFTDDKNGVGIRLSSVHKAKGLEAKRVFILLPPGAGMPHPMAKSAWQKEQEINILYIAITRAMYELVYVT